MLRNEAVGNQAKARKLCDGVSPSERGFAVIEITFVSADERLLGLDKRLFAY